MAVEDLIREWDANGDGAVTKMEFRQSLRNPKLELVADNVSELDALFDRLDKDKGGSLDLGEVKAAMKIMQTESAHAEKAVEKAKQQASHWRVRAAQMSDAAETTRELAAAELTLLESRIMLGKEAAPKPGEKIRGALGARMYATMVKRGEYPPPFRRAALVPRRSAHVAPSRRGRAPAPDSRTACPCAWAGMKITEISNKKHGRIDRKEFRMTVETLVPAALREEVDAMFDSFDIDVGGTLDLEELRACLRLLQESAATAAKLEASQLARVALLHFATAATQEAVDEAIAADIKAAEDEKAAGQAAAAKRAADKVAAEAAKAAKVAEKAKKEADEKAAFEARVAAKKAAAAKR